MTNNFSPKEKAEQFRALHHNGKMLILPNIWDPLGALLLKDLEYPAIATASAAVAFSNGYQDGENIPFTDLVILCRKITNCVNLPVTADIETGYANSDSQLRENIEQLIEAGIVGINFEDADRKTKQLQSLDVQSRKIELIRKTAEDLDVPLFINARTDVFIHRKNFDSDEEVLNEAVKRGLAYKEAGADGFFPILVTQEKTIKELVTRVDLPVNILTFPGIPDLKTLSELGVARVSLGPSFLKIAIQAMKKLAVELKQGEGLSSIIGNEITSDYLKKLVN